MAGSDICNVSNSHAQLSVLKKRMKYGSNKIQNLSGDLNAFEPDFSKRLAKTCIDGVYHPNGLIDCSPYKSQPFSPYQSSEYIQQINCAGTMLGRDANGNYLSTGNCIVTTTPTSGNWSWLYSQYEGVGDLAFGSADTVVVKSLKWQFPAGSKTGTSVNVIKGTCINTGHRLYLRMPARDETAGIETFQSSIYVMAGDVSGANDDFVTIVLNIVGSGVTIGVIKAMFNISNTNVGQGAIQEVEFGPYTQANPRSNVVNGMCVYQPPLSLFDQDNGVFIGDMSLILTPNSNWKQSIVESSVTASRYDQDVVHGRDFCFGIKSLRLYIARCRIPEQLPKQLNFSMPDMIVSNKQLSNGQNNLDFIIPPSTQQIVIWIQDSACGNNSKIPFSRFKARQNSAGGDLSRLNTFGPWAKTYDENVQSMQLTFAGIVKPMSLFQTGNGNSISKPDTSVSMLQRYLMNNQNQQRSDQETYFDWLSQGPYYLFDFTRDSTNLGTYLSVKIAFNGDFPTIGKVSNDVQSTLTLNVCSIYRRDFALTYSELGNVVSVQSAMQ